MRHVYRRARARGSELCLRIKTNGEIEARIFNLSNEANDAQTEFGVAVGDELITVPGRVLDTPTIEYQKIAPRDPNTRPRVPTTLRPGQGSWNFAEVGLYKPAELGYWYCLRIAIGKDSNNSHLTPASTLICTNLV